MSCDKGEELEKDSNLLDIIIVNYNSTDYLLICLKSIYYSLQDLPAKIFVQDNASGDNVDIVNKMFPRVVLSKNSYNMGFAKAVNNGLRQGFAPYVVILNPDTYVQDNFFSTVTSYMEEDLDVGLIGPKILDQDGSVQGSARSFPSPLTGLFGRSSFLTKWFPGNPISSQNVLTERSDGKTPIAVDWVSGACMVVRRGALDNVGFMDERFFMYWEDADWCKRMWHSGWKVVYFPRASIIHYVGRSSEKLWVRSIIEFHKSAYRLFEKHASLPLCFAKPAVLLALGVRLILVLYIQGIQRALSGPLKP
jgi:GT2 family glycosyltransferase